MVRRILTLPRDREMVRSRSVKVKSVDKEILSLIADMKDTWADAGAYGISAVQIGDLKRIILFRSHEGDAVVVINPKILSAKGEEMDYDGCLSIPGIYAKTRRATEIELTGLSPDGSHYRKHLEGFTARIAQHELDHLDGILFIDRLDSMDDLYTLEKVTAEDGEIESQEVPLDKTDERFIQRERQPLPGFALQVQA